jgi:hypothetical protein
MGLLLFTWVDNVSGGWVTVLTDNFNISAPPDANQNIDLDIRQTGSKSPNPWEDYGTGNTLPGGEYDSQVIINSSSQLQIFVGGPVDPQGNIIIPGQTDLPQLPNYKLQWDQGADEDWSFLKFHTNSEGSYKNCGFLVWGNNSSFPGRVQFYLNNSSVYDSLNTHPSGLTPTGENGLHHIEVTVLNGQMSALIDNTATVTANLVGIVGGTGTSGIGSVSFCARPYDEYGYLDNLLYQVEAPEHCGDLGTQYLVGDLSGPSNVPDCYVNLIDFSVIALQWLTCTDPAISGCDGYWK